MIVNSVNIFNDIKNILGVVNKFLIVGSGGRESIFATQLAKDTELYAIMSHENPSIIDCVSKSDGQYTISDPNDPEKVLEFAKKFDIDYVFVNADQPLANGVVDVLIDNNFKAIGGTRAATRIEWDKVYSITLMQQTCPEFTPFHRIVSNNDELVGALSEFESKGIHVVVKPQGLTGGKGVKVMPEHLESYNDCRDYAAKLLDSDGKVLLVEKLDGIEFTIMGLVDGKNLVLTPASYDYPFRYDGDTGPGTGGMGCFTGPMMLPFMTDKDLAECKTIMQRIIDEMRARDVLFCGILNGGFFKTKQGIRFMEFNSRFGDPEVLNILSVLNSSFSELLIHLWNGTLSVDVVSFTKKSSVSKYLVAKEYPTSSKESLSFTINESAIKEMGVDILFAACVKTDDHQYQTLKSSRVVGFVATADRVEDASELIDRAIESHVTSTLEYRRDIGSSDNLTKLENMVTNL